MQTLIVGGDHIDRMAYAMTHAQKLLCRDNCRESEDDLCSHCRRLFTNAHPNVTIISPSISSTGSKPTEPREDDDSGLIKVDQIREIIIENQKHNYEGGLSVFIISHMHRATRSAANALLKVLEDGNLKKIFLALAPSRSAVLPTIASRFLCHVITPSPISKRTGQEKFDDLLMRISKTKKPDRFLVCSSFSFDRDALMNELSALQESCHSLLRREAIPPTLALKILESLKLAMDRLQNNLNTRSTVENLVLQEWPYHLS